MIFSSKEVTTNYSGEDDVMSRILHEKTMEDATCQACRRAATSVNTAPQLVYLKNMRIPILIHHDKKIGIGASLMVQVARRLNDEVDEKDEERKRRSGL